MTRLGYFLTCEEFAPEDLVEQARRAEQAGFEALWISDHIHPWNSAQGNSPFVWSVIGALSQVTSLPVMTAVTCPTVRMHPLLVAHAAATSAVMLEGRFVLGLGSGEALNEHVLGDPWPAASVRLDMLEEAVELIRKLWEGGPVTHRGRHYTTDRAQIWNLPEEPIEIHISGFGPRATELAARIGDGYVQTTPSSELLDLFRSGAADGATASWGTKVAWAASEDEGAEHAHRLWGTSGIPGEIAQELPTPRHFEQAAELVTLEQSRERVVCGPDVARHVEHLRTGIDAGYDWVMVSNIGPHWREMIEVYGSEVLPEFRSTR